MTFGRNEGAADRVLRLVVGGALVASAVTGPHWKFGWLGVILLVTAALGVCPLYAIFGFSTCGRKTVKP